jgi:hypothetical protein
VPFVVKAFVPTTPNNAVVVSSLPRKDSLKTTALAADLLLHPISDSTRIQK